MMANIEKHMNNHGGSPVKKLFGRITASLGAAVLMLPMISTLRIQTANASTPTFNFYTQVGQPSTSNTNQQGWTGISGEGFDYPFALKIDTVLHHLFVVDKNNHRVLVFNLDNDNELIDKTADYVIGQTSMSGHDANQGNINPTASTLSNPQDLAIDETTHLLYVSDTDNARVMVYNTANLSNGMSASHVLGKNVMDIGVAPSEPVASSLISPYGIAVDSVHDRLFVANNPSRVSVFDISEGITDGQNAVAFIGQNDGTSSWNGCSGDIDSNTLCNVAGGIAYNVANNKLYVSDSQNHRVLEFDATNITNAQDATYALGQADASTQSFNGSTTASNVSDPRALAVDETNQKLYVSDAGYNSSNRISVYALASGDFSNNQDATNELGQANFTDYYLNRHSGGNWLGYAAANTTALPYGVAFNTSTGKLFVADSENNRVLLYDTTTVSDGEDAVDVLGQPSFVSWGDNAQSPTANGFAFNAVTEIDPVHHRMFVADYQNERVLVFNLTSDNVLVDKTADHVLGAPDMFSLNWDKCDFPTAATLCFGEGIFGGLAYDATNDYLYVTGGLNSRVVVYDTATIIDGEDAVGLLGQPDYDSNDGCDWDEGISERTLCYPGNLALDTINHRLYIADTGNNRVLMYELDDENYPADNTADAVIGQANFYSTGQNADGMLYGLNYPNGVSFDETNLRLYVADTGNSRIASYDISDRVDGVISGMKDNGDITGMPTDMILGQSDPDGGNGCNRDNGDAAEANTLCYPEGVHIDSVNNRLYVADSNNHRVLGYQLTDSGDYQNTFSNGQDADVVVGQPDMNGSHCNLDQQGASEDSLCYPWGVTYDDTSDTLYVADTSNNRVTIYANGPVDSDNDGIGNDTEDAAPNGGDANGDGEADSTQSNVTNFRNATDNKYIAVQTDCGQTTPSNEQVAATAEDTNHADAAYHYPSGLASFTFNCEGTGTVTQYFYGDFDSTTVTARKYNPIDHTYTTIPGATISKEVIGGEKVLKVVYQITDNGPLDQDPTVGTITDPSGPAVLAVAAPNTGFGGASR